MIVTTSALLVVEDLLGVGTNDESEFQPEIGISGVVQPNAVFPIAKLVNEAVQIGRIELG